MNASKTDRSRIWTPFGLGMSLIVLDIARNDLPPEDIGSYVFLYGLGYAIVRYLQGGRYRWYGVVQGLAFALIAIGIAQSRLALTVPGWIIAFAVPFVAAYRIGKTLPLPDVPKTPQGNG